MSFFESVKKWGKEALKTAIIAGVISTAEPAVAQSQETSQVKDRAPQEVVKTENDVFKEMTALAGGDETLVKKWLGYFDQDTVRVKKLFEIFTDLKNQQDKKLAAQAKKASEVEEDEEGGSRRRRSGVVRRSDEELIFLAQEELQRQEAGGVPLTAQEVKQEELEAKAVEKQTQQEILEKKQQEAREKLPNNLDSFFYNDAAIIGLDKEKPEDLEKINYYESQLESFVADFIKRLSLLKQTKKGGKLTSADYLAAMREANNSANQAANLVNENDGEDWQKLMKILQKAGY